MSGLKKGQKSLNLFNMYFNDEVIEFFNENSIHIQNIELISIGKIYEPSFKLFSRQQTFFVKFSIYERFSDCFLAELSEINRQNENYLLLPFLSENIPSIRRQINVYKWIEGNNLKYILNNAPSDKITEYGYRCGNILKRIHFRMKAPNEPYNHIIQSFNKYMARLDENSFRFSKKFDYRDFFYQNSNLLTSIDNRCFVHMDYKPKNIMLYNNKITVIDLDSCMVGDPWMDFYDKAFSLYKDKEIFNASLIRAYFDDHIPDNFFEYFRILSVYALIKNTAYLIQRKDMQYIRFLESYLWNSYDGFSELIPRWII